MLNGSSQDIQENVKSEALDSDVLNSESGAAILKDPKNGHESSENITEVFLGTVIPAIETDDKSEEMISSTLTMDDNLLHHIVDVTESDNMLETVQSMIVNMASNTTHSDGEDMTIVTHTELEKDEILTSIKDFVEDTPMYTLSDGQIPIKIDEMEEKTDIEEKNLEDIMEEEITTVYPEEELTTTRRLPEKYTRTRARPTITIT